MDETVIKDAIIEAMLPDVPFDGWTRHALAAAARRVGVDQVDLAVLFPSGARDAVAAFSRWADRKALERLAEKGLGTKTVRDRIADAVTTRLAVLAPHREAVRRALAFLALPTNVPLGLKLLYETVDALWYAAGDEATDFSFYTKRALLAGVYAGTTLYWLDDRSSNEVDTQAFLRRRLDDVLALPRVRARVRRTLHRLPNPIRMVRAARQ